MTRFAFVLAALVAISCTACSSTSTSRGGDADSMEVIPLQYVDATSTAARLRAAHADTKIVAQPSTNAIIVVGSAAEVDEIRRAVRSVDRPS